jgi:hypothetical protein
MEKDNETSSKEDEEGSQKDETLVK